SELDATGRHVTNLPSAPMSAGARLRDVDDPLMPTLKEWRLTTARSDGVPAYVVATDALLAEIVDQRPTTIPGLRAGQGDGALAARSIWRPSCSRSARRRGSRPN